MKNDDSVPYYFFFKNKNQLDFDNRESLYR